MGDGVFIWMSNTDPALRGVYAAGKVAGERRNGYPLDWGDEKQQGTETPFVALAIHWYLIHHPVTVHELRVSDFSGHQILRMPRRTAYSCDEAEFACVINLMRGHGPTALPVRRAVDFSAWWDIV